MTKEDKNLKTVMKFDSGADGFQGMIYVLAFLSVVTLISGIIFIKMTF